VNVEGVIRELEQRLLHPAVRASAAELRQLLADDFVEFGSSGRTFTKESIIAALQANPVPSADVMAEFRVRELGPELALATSRCGASLRSSVWRLEGNQWKIVFHQGTRSAPAETSPEPIASWPKGLRRVLYAIVVASGLFVLQLGLHWGRGAGMSRTTIVYTVASGVLYALVLRNAARGLRTLFVNGALALVALHLVFMVLFFEATLKRGLATGWSAAEWTNWAQQNFGVLAWNGVLLILSAGLGVYLLAIERQRVKKHRQGAL
jgi:hypothetical protein